MLQVLCSASCSARSSCSASSRSRQAGAARGARRPGPSPAAAWRQQRRSVRSAAAAAGQATTGQERSEQWRPTSTASFILSSGVVDYYELLGVDDIASPAEIKAAYRALAKVCHVDISGDTESNRNICIMLNEAYEVLMDPESRTAYNAELDAALADEDDGYTGEPLSKWMANTKMGKNTDPKENRAVFVDENTCIGCKQCVWCAPATFRIEDTYGRSRVFAQWIDKEDDIQAAIEACPVSCIHWVTKDDLPALEFVTQNKVKRTNVAAMMAQQGFVEDVFAATEKYLKERRRKEEDRARAARWSAAQEAARRQAAQDIMNKQDGWFASFAMRFGMSNLAANAAAAMEQTVFGASYSSDDEYAGYSKVGRRVRSRRRVDRAYGAKNAGGGKVPRERALVPTGAALRPWRRDIPDSA